MPEREEGCDQDFGDWHLKWFSSASVSIALDRLGPITGF